MSCAKDLEPYQEVDMSSESKTRGPVMAHIRLHPGVTIQEICDDLGISKAVVTKHVRAWRNLPIGHKDRLRVRKWIREADRGPWAMGLEFDHQKRDNDKPIKRTNSEICKKWWEQNKAKRALARSIKRGPRIAQGGQYGIWAGLL